MENKKTFSYNEALTNEDKCNKEFIGIDIMNFAINRPTTNERLKRFEVIEEENIKYLYNKLPNKLKERSGIEEKNIRQKGMKNHLRGSYVTSKVNSFKQTILKINALKELDDKTKEI